MDYVKTLAGMEAGQPVPQQQPSFMESLENELTLSYQKRIVCFAVTLVLGLGCCFLSTWLLVFPRVFAKWYSIGSILILGSTFFLRGPVAQMKSMCDSSRYLASTIYIMSIILTLFFALYMHRIGLSMIMVVVQVCAAVWYAASYIWFAQDCIKTSISAARSTLNI